MSKDPGYSDSKKDTLESRNRFLQERNETLINKIEYLNQVNDGLHLLLKEAEAKEKKLIAVLKMVENNSLMPHKHEDYYTRLCCLSERASEILKEIGEE